MKKMKQNHPNVQNFHIDLRRPNKPFGTNNPKYSCYHLTGRIPAEICFCGCKMHLNDNKWTYLSIFWKVIYSHLTQKISKTTILSCYLCIFFFWCMKLPYKYSNNKFISCESKKNKDRRRKLKSIPFGII
jgi:hypothetical protein